MDIFRYICMCVCACVRASARTWAIPAKITFALSIFFFITEQHSATWKDWAITFHLRTVIASDWWCVSVFMLWRPPQSADLPLRLSHLIIDLITHRMTACSLTRCSNNVFWITLKRRRLRRKESRTLLKWGGFRTLSEKEKCGRMSQEALKQNYVPVYSWFLPSWSD